MKNQGLEKIQYKQTKSIPNISSLLKILLGLIIVAIISTSFVYADTTSVSIDGTSYDIEYTGNGVSVTGVEADMDFVSLIFSVDVTSSPGTLSVNFDRGFFDSKFEGIDEEFFVIVDGADVSFDEEKTSTYRILSMELPEGTEEIEIIGSTFGTPVEEPPVVEEPVEEPPVVEEPVEEPPVVEEPVEEPPVVEEPVEEPPVVEEPVEEPPVVEEPVEEPTPSETPTTPVTTPEETAPRTECGPGTILKDGVCVLDETCGPGTILKDGVCVLKPTPPATTDIRGMGSELVITLIVGFIVAGGIGIMIALISKAGKSRD